MKALWMGRLPLARAFWEYAIAYALLANLCATGAALVLVAAGLPTALAIAVFLLPLPYFLVAVVGVWRSANVYAGNPRWAAMARYAACIWTVLMVVA